MSDSEERAAGPAAPKKEASLGAKVGFHVISWALVGLAFFLLRLELTNTMGLSFSAAWQARLGLGLIRDVAALSGLAAVVWLLYALMGLRQCFLWSIGTWLLFFANLANVQYFRMFGCPLALWTVGAHFPEAGTFFQAVMDAQFSPLVAVAIGMMVFSTLLSFVASYGRLALSGAIGQRLFPLLLVLAFGGVWQAGRKVPVLFSEQGETILTEETVTTWFDQINHILFEKGNKEAASVVAAYGKQLAGRPVVAENRADNLRQLLGFGAGQPLNVVLLFVNNWRSFELLQPSTSQLVMPEISQLIEEKSLYFPQAYSSAVGAGHHEQAVYSVLCSRMPNNVGPAAIVANSALPLTCLQQQLRSKNYLTAWLGGFSSSYHGLHSFELLQGTDFIYDLDYFESHGLSEKIGTSGLADGPFLQNSLELLIKLGQQGRPFFAQVTTSSANYPYSYMGEGGELNPLILERGSAFPEYLGYLSRLRYDDAAVSAFINKLLASPLGDSTVIFLVGNHGSTVVPYDQLNNTQLVELAARVPMAIISKKIAQARRYTFPVHQIDVAPTIAALTGAQVDSHWQGRGLLSGAAAPWMQLKGGLPSYRLGDTACYTTERDRRPHCYNLAGQDPLLVRELLPADLNEKMLGQVKNFFIANGWLIRENHLEAP